MRLLALTFALALAPHAASAAAQHDGSKALTFEPLPFQVRTAEGVELAVQAGKLRVPENRRAKRSREITLTFARIASRAVEPGPPLIYLHGGPGGEAAGAIRDPDAMSLWATFLDLGDVILLDQRGCGRSEPKLARPWPKPPPPGIFSSRTAFDRFLAESGKAVREQLIADGFDLAGYDTEQSADDVADLIEALEVPKARLLGFSYGTHLGLSVIRRHGDRVASAILIGVEGPDETAKLPSVWEVHLRKLAAIAARDPGLAGKVPDFVALLRRALERLEREPLAVKVEQPITEDEVEVEVGPDGLRFILVRDLGDTTDIPVLPRLLHTIERGDPSVLRWFVQKRYGTPVFPTHLFTVDVASGVSADRAARIVAEAPACILGNAMNFGFGGVAEKEWQTADLGEAFRSPIVSDVRTLFLSGTLDVNTPPQQAERVRFGFRDSVHLVQEHGGHEDWMRNPKVLPVLHAFLAGDDVSGRDVDMEPLRFIPIDGAPGKLSHPSLRRD